VKIENKYYPKVTYVSPFNEGRRSIIPKIIIIEEKQEHKEEAEFG
jgi:hypothetical protein